MRPWAPELQQYVAHLQNGGDDGGSPYTYRYIGALVGEVPGVPWGITRHVPTSVWVESPH